MHKSPTDPVVGFVPLSRLDWKLAYLVRVECPLHVPNLYVHISTLHARFASISGTRFGFVHHTPAGD